MCVINLLITCMFFATLLINAVVLYCTCAFNSREFWAHSIEV